MKYTTTAAIEIDEKQIVIDELTKCRDLFLECFHNGEVAQIIDDALYNYLRIKGKEQ